MKAEHLEKLNEVIPFKWRVQKIFNKTKCIMVAYIDSRDVQNKLDEVCHPYGWQNKFENIKGNLFCHLGILIDGEWIWKSDVGTPSNSDPAKGEASDALKRAAVLWGINRDAYSVGTVTLNGKDYNGKIYPCDSNGNFLKGQALNDLCNKLAKIEELDNYVLNTKETNEKALA